MSTDDINSNVHGALSLDREDQQQEMQKDYGVKEDELQIGVATDSGEEKSFAKVPHSVFFEQGVGKESEFEEETVVEGQEKKLVKVKLSIVFVSSEAAPYSKTGGLGDVCGSLPIALAERGHRVMVVSPRYIHGTAADKIYADAFDADCRIKVNCFGGPQEVAFFHEYKNGVDWVRK